MIEASNNTNIPTRHPRSLADIYSAPHRFVLVPNPTRRYLRKLALEYLHCSDCESGDITYYGVNASGNQKYRCKACDYQFVARFDAYFPRSTRRLIFEKEYLSNLQRQGFREGVGRQEYWEGALQATLNMIESQRMKVLIGKMLKAHPIECDRDYRLMVQYIVHEAYLIAR